LLIELTRDLRLHPVHYLLVELALTIFFLRLISLSEHVEFWIAYLVAALACAGQVSLYLVAVLGRVASGVRSGALLGGLYGMLYVILLSEDNALLMGSLLLFLALASVMFITRRLDWYSIGGTRRSTPST
jgi:inner membrane protein